MVALIPTYNKTALRSYIQSIKVTSPKKNEEKSVKSTRAADASEDALRYSYEHYKYHIKRVL